ncbi:MAG: Unknown protein [uncultured Campylobacterales bacterium]|uniref:Uncharacterized protein n=1 Tax=uncultured Campylobacterales bacterium TaxID=352960 RepID=A0A6S6SZC2_9BACT|nr:MAG: Unknown protein [uncultured Campylobacterales bacterium]
MQYIRNKFEQMVQEVNPSSTDYLKQEFKSILESDKPYQVKCDYIGYSIASIDDKITSIGEQIKELQEYKSKLKLAKGTVAVIGAEIFNQFGIDKIEGNGISSITTTKKSMTNKRKFIIDNPEVFIKAGFYKKVLDTNMVEELYDGCQYIDFIETNATIQNETIIKEAKLKINKRRGKGA